MATKVARLIMVSEQNNNKFYNMTVAEGSSIIEIEYGRVQKTSVKETYPIFMWDKKYNEKIKKGYKDVTNLYATIEQEEDKKQPEKKSSMGDIQNLIVKKLFDELQAYANKSIAQNYTVKVENVTQAQVDEAQKALDEITREIKVGAKKDILNKHLLNLYSIVPRQMSNVKSHLFENDLSSKTLVESAQNKIAEEQATLDVMAGQVAQLKAQNELNKPTKEGKEEAKKALNILDVMGLEITPVTDPKIIAMIKDKMNDLKINGQQDNSKIFKQAFRVINKKTQARFDKYLATAQNKQCQLLWHGSRNANFIGILEQGLKIRPTGVSINGKAFGEGTYFACHSGKSLNYTDYRGSYRSYTGGNSSQAFLLLFNVNVGKQKVVHTSGNYTLAQCRKEGCDSIHAKPTAGSYIAYDEFITFNEDQYTVQYLIEVQ